MRIISGKYKGKHIYPPKGFTARPTTDFAKESLFNILANSFDFEDIEVLDLFSGTGSIGYEFASRGALKVHCIDLNFKYVSFIQKTANDLKFESIRVIKANVFQFIKGVNSKYDIIFADPPYDLDGVELLPDLILKKEILKDEGCFILEHSKKKDFSNHPQLFDHREYGSVNYSFFR